LCHDNVFGRAPMARAWRQMERTHLSGTEATQFLKTEDQLERIQE